MSSSEKMVQTVYWPKETIQSLKILALISVLKLCCFFFILLQKIFVKKAMYILGCRHGGVGVEMGIRLGSTSTHIETDLLKLI